MTSWLGSSYSTSPSRRKTPSVGKAMVSAITCTFGTHCAMGAVADSLKTIGGMMAKAEALSQHTYAGPCRTRT
eukprot:6199352-Pleurochrysis_carterae.AAC.1